MWFEIGGLKIATEAVLGFEQTYEPLAGAARLRLMSGAAVHGQSCASCGDPIDPRRIVIMPDAVRCVTCEDASRP